MTRYDDDAFARMYVVYRLGRRVGLVRKSHSNGWSWEGIDLTVDDVKATREQAAEGAFAAWIRRHPDVGAY